MSSTGQLYCTVSKTEARAKRAIGIKAAGEATLRLAGVLPAVDDAKNTSSPASAMTARPLRLRAAAPAKSPVSINDGMAATFEMKSETAEDPEASLEHCAWYAPAGRLTHKRAFMFSVVGTTNHGC